LELTDLLGSYQNLEMVLDSMSEAIIAHDLERKITFFNRAAERMTGLSRKEVLGGDCHRVIQGGLCGSRCSFCEECVPTFELMQYPVVITDRDGRSHQVEMTVVPMQDASGEVVGALAVGRDVTELHQLRQSLKREKSFEGLVGKHEKMQALYGLIREVAPSDVTVLVQGESGTGKELVAAAIHSLSDRAGRPFVPVNCAALPEGLLESELFGHVRGAFTGAIRDKRGRFESADGGTLFLDEVGELTPATQVKLLRVLQERRFEPVGSEGSVDVDVRIISATNRNLKEQVKKGGFREDLYFRLCVVPLTIPPLHERRTDILVLADHFLERFCAETGRAIPTLSGETSRVLMDYPWPGNVRELMNVLQYALVMTRGGVIEPGHLPPELSAVKQKSTRNRAGRKRKLTTEQVRDAMDRANGNRAEAARLLGVGRSTLYRYLDSASRMSHDT
jgi:sigma-54 dependent transcriptional regulator, acetoin dehydrogenase operon transcriptional activator AcoR